MSSYIITGSADNKELAKVIKVKVVWIYIELSQTFI